MSMVMISVYCPTYNRPEIFASRALPSVLNQTYTDFEFIVMDDGSDFETYLKYLEIIEAAGDPRIILHGLPPESRKDRFPPEYPTWADEEKAKYWWLMGPAWAANHALNQCKRKWIARIDDDDIWLPEHLDRLMVCTVEKPDVQFLSSKYMVIDRDGQRVIGPDEFGIGGTQTWLYRRDLNLRYNYDCWRKSWNRNNDIDFAQQVVSSGANVGFLSSVTAIILPRPGETTIGSKAYLEDPEKALKWIRGE